MNHSLIEDGPNNILRVRGELDAISSPELRPTLAGLEHRPGCNVTIDLSDLTLIDSSGLGALVSLYKRVRSIGGKVAFVGVANQPLAVFKLLGLDRAFRLNETPSPVRPVRAPQRSGRFLRTLNGWGTAPLPDQEPARALG